MTMTTDFKKIAFETIAIEQHALDVLAKQIDTRF
ncbi:D-arabinose 5-phosphate isomerase, partial [Acinetobacter baumannii]